MGGEPVRLHDVGVWIEPDLGLVDLLDFDMARHLATLPLSAVFVEWEDTSEARGHAAMERQADVHAHGHGHA
jgi:hypothetical protein